MKLLLITISIFVHFTCAGMCAGLHLPRTQATPERTISSRQVTFRQHEELAPCSAFDYVEKEINTINAITHQENLGQKELKIVQQWCKRVVKYAANSLMRTQNIFSPRPIESRQFSELYNALQELHACAKLLDPASYPAIKPFDFAPKAYKEEAPALRALITAEYIKFNRFLGQAGEYHETKARKKSQRSRSWTNPPVTAHPNSASSSDSSTSSSSTSSSSTSSTSSSS